jgi:alpha-1,2-mannosyltransferase
VASGGTPYDEAALAALGRSLGLVFVTGGGYSYPPPFAVAMVPLAQLPFPAAVTVFTVASILVFAATIAWWLPAVVPGAGRGRMRAALALGAGLYPPVGGSVFAGQANLLVFGLLGFGLVPFIPPVGAWQRRAGESRAGLVHGAALGLAGIVKLAPLAVAVPLVLAIRAGRSATVLVGLVAAALGSLVVAAVVAPASSSGASGLGQLFSPDPFSTNESINGGLSRLFLDGDRTSGLLPGDPVPFVVTATLGLGIATAVVLAVALRRRRDAEGLAVGLAYAVVAAAVGAPKNSFWNDTPVLLAVGLALTARALPGPPRRRVLVLAWVVATIVQFGVDRWLPSHARATMGVATLLSDAGVVALLALWLALTDALLARDDVSIGQRAVRSISAGA